MPECKHARAYYEVLAENYNTAVFNLLEAA
jgi:hypothetical protein